MYLFSKIAVAIWALAQPKDYRYANGIKWKKTLVMEFVKIHADANVSSSFLSLSSMFDVRYLGIALLLSNSPFLGINVADKLRMSGIYSYHMFPYHFSYQSEKREQITLYLSRLTSVNIISYPIQMIWSVHDENAIRSWFTYKYKLQIDHMKWWERNKTTHTHTHTKMEVELYVSEIMRCTQ